MRSEKFYAVDIRTKTFVGKTKASKTFSNTHTWPWLMLAG